MFAVLCFFSLRGVENYFNEWLPPGWRLLVFLLVGPRAERFNLDLFGLLIGSVSVFTP